jgi:dihydrodipicolinate synthase/N-acetylneuraminate lyase
MANSNNEKKPLCEPLRSLRLCEKVSTLRARLLEGHVIPAHPLALTQERTLDERRQRALTRYYKDAGAGGIAVGVHTTQFAIRQAGLYESVLRLAAQEAQNILKIAGICGDTPQALNEANIATNLGYDAGLLSLAKPAPDDLLNHANQVAQVIPLFGFYLQPAVGGRILPYDFWRRFFDIAHVVAVKVAPFNRYQTIEVARALKNSGRAHEIALYTGNDDSIVHDLQTDFDGLRFVGGLLGQFAVWTHAAVKILNEIKNHKLDPKIPYALTDANAALFDAANNFKGSIAGIHEILRRQGLLRGRWCLDPAEDLSPGQLEQIDRVTRAYPFLEDDAFVKANLSRWLDA